MKAPTSGGWEFAVVDLDGTLANTDHRAHHVAKIGFRNFEAFYNEMDKDTVNPWCLALVKSLIKNQIIVVLLSARPKRYDVQTIQWLDDQGLMAAMADGWVRLRLLGRDDHTPDHHLKQEWLNKHPDHRASILFAVDDRPRVISMWRKEGVTCLDCGTWRAP